jgi:hypothetical protein
MKKLLKLTDGTPIKSALIDLLIWIKFDSYFSIMRLIAKLPIPFMMKFKAIVWLRKASK